MWYLCSCFDGCFIRVLECGVIPGLRFVTWTVRLIIARLEKNPGDKAVSALPAEMGHSHWVTMMEREA